jgi:hypothetical protein
MNNNNNKPAPADRFAYITLLAGNRIPPLLCVHPMVHLQTIHALFGKGEPLDVWQKELIDGWVTVARKIGISQDPPVIRRAGKITHISLYMAFGASLLDTSFQGMIGRIPILEAAFGKHSAESLMRALNLCVALKPNAEQQIDLRLLHEYLKLREPFSLWSARAVKHLELELNRDYFKPSGSGRGLGLKPPFWVSKATAHYIAQSSGSHRSFQLHFFIYRRMKFCAMNNLTLDQS